VEAIRRAWSTFTVDTKSLDTEQRILEGLASTPALDRQGHSMDPAGAVYEIPLKFLWQHKTEQPLGEVIAARVTEAGIWMRAKLAPAGLLPFIDDAWRLLKSGLVGGLSIDWLPLAPPRPLPNGGLRFASWQWVALSAVTIPANTQASITLIKSLDLSPTGSAAPGGSPRPVHRPGASGDRIVIPMFNVSETLTAERTAMQTKSARLEALVAEEHAHGLGSLDADQTTERETLLAELAAHTTKIKHLSTLEEAQAALAAPIVGLPAVRPRQAPAVAPRVEVVPLAKGARAVRAVLAIAAGRGSYSDTIAFAKRFTDTPEVAAYVKSTMGVAQPGPGSPPSGWGFELVQPDVVNTEFVELLRPEIILGKITGFHPAWFNAPIITQTVGSTFDWVGEGVTKPVGELAFDKTMLGFSKCAGIIVLSDELVRFSRPNAEEIARTDMVAQCARFLDAAFIQASKAGATDRPASITNGAPTVPATGVDYQALAKDLNTALGHFDAAGIPTMNLAVVMPPAVARGISSLVGPLGTPIYPTLTPQGGTILGYQVAVSATADPGTITIFAPGEILLADDGKVMLDASNQATLAMSGSTATFSLWQNNAIGIRAERYIRWQPRRADVVVVITGAAYGPQ
jgi:HK97 family phage major capsid protein